MVTEDDNRWSLFCKEHNSSSETNDAHMNECSVNFAAFLLHVVFTIIACLVLIGNTFNGVLSLRYLSRWTGHTLRYTLLLLLMICALASLGEGILTEMSRQEAGSPQMQFYLPSCLLLIANFVAIIYYQLTEKWRQPPMIWLLFVYWLCCIAINILRISLLFRENVDAGVFILWNTLLMLVFYVFLTSLEIYLIVTKVCNNRHSDIDQEEKYHNNTKYTEDYVSLPYKLTFWWLSWLFKIGFQHPLEMKDLGSLPESHRAEHLYQIFKDDFQKELDEKRASSGTPSVWKVFGRVYKTEIIFAGFSRLMYDSACLVGPLALSGIVDYVIDYGRPREVDPSHQYITVQEYFSNGYILVGVIFFANILQYFSFQQNFYQSNVVGVHIRTSLQTMVYDKALRLSSYTISGGSMTVGQITNHMSADAFNMFFFCQRMHYLWSIPFRLIAVSCLLYIQVQSVTFLALAALLIAIPFELLTSRIQTTQQESLLKHSDDRLKRSNEMLLGIKLLKMNGWEEMFCKAIEAIRNLEMSSLFRYNGCYSFGVFVVHCSPVLMNLARAFIRIMLCSGVCVGEIRTSEWIKNVRTREPWEYKTFSSDRPLSQQVLSVVFVSYPYITGKPLTPTKTFTALALMNLLLEVMYYTPIVSSLTVNAFISTRRLQRFFMAPEMESLDEIDLKEMKYNTTQSSQNANGYNEKTPLLQAITAEYESVLSQTDQEATRITERSKFNYALKIENGDFSWGNESSTPFLKNINLLIPHGELTMVVGGVGSGKSSLLSAILGEMTTLNGSVTVGSQANTIPSALGVAYGAQKAWLMNATLRDNVLFGQKFNQGRYRKVIDSCALKQDIDILPGGDMTEIGEKGINLSGGQKQRVSVARTMYSNKPIVLLDDPLSALDVNVGGHLFRDGIMGRLRKANRTVVLVTHQLQFLQKADKIVIMKEGQINFQGTFDDIAHADPDLYQKWQQDVVTATDSELSDGGLSTCEESALEERETLRRRVNVLKNQGELSMSKSMFSVEESVKGKLIQKEDLARGSVSYSTYWYYFRNMGLFWACLLPCARLLLEALKVSNNFLLSRWSEASLDSNRTVDDISSEYVGPYVALAGVGCIMAGVCGASLLVSTWNAAKAVYLQMIRAVSRSPMRFFDTTPIGRIMNRFSSDVQIIDTKLNMTLWSALHMIVFTSFTITVNIIITPIFLVEIIPIVIVYIVLAMYFIRSSRELQRLDSVTRSPVFAHFSETLGGLTTLRAYREQKSFFSTLLKRIDTNNTAFLYLQAAYGWLGLQMSICGGFMVLMVSLTTLLQATILGNLDPSSVGLSISYVLIISYGLFELVRFAADTEMQMNPVERVQFYANIPTENYEGKPPPPDWPSRGAIQIEHVSVRYAENLPPVLQDITLYVQPGEKVGICGRTGSGKSSLTLSLLRLIQTYRGQIIIDGENIAAMPLTTLRQRLSIIPQDPILFTGSIRSNLDPTSINSDQELWNALEIAQLKPIVSQFDLGLDTTVSEGGENFSVGQRQLFCLARAFLRNSRVLIMDEATASIDYTTEKLLQDVVASAFKEKTVLTIAHRVSTIRDSDTIWVLGGGDVIECDSPENLLARETSEFYSMVQANK